eukprot:8403796-Pyramimonas_sp.AAC.1
MQEVRAKLLSDGAPHQPPKPEQLKSFGPQVANPDAEPPPAEHPLVDLSYADDGTVTLIMPAEQIHDALSRTLVLVSDAFARRGHQLNVGPSKTAALT